MLRGLDLSELRFNLGPSRNLIKKPWAFIRLPCMSPNILRVIGPGFLNRVPTLGL